MPRIALAALLACVACRRSAPIEARPALPVDIADAADANDAKDDGAIAADARTLSPFEIALADDPPFGDNELRAVCGRRTACRIRRSIAAGTDSRGRAMQLVTALDFPPGAVAREFEEFAFEHWVLYRLGGHIDQRQLLFDDRHLDPADAEGRATAGLTLKGSRIHYSYLWPGISGRFRGYKSHVVSLDPLRLERLDWPGFDAFTADVSWSVSFDYARVIGIEESEHPACTGTTIPATKAKRVAIPQLAVDSSFATSWRTTSIAACSTLVDGAKNGFVLAGTADASDAALSLLATSDHELFVELHDDVLTTPGTGTIGDELLIWTSPHFVGMGMQCDATTATTRFRVTAADGKVSHVSGPTSSAPTVELAAGPPRRLRVVFPEDVSSWAIGYRDTDDGATFERTIATSKIRAAVATELGTTFRVRPEDARCVRVGSALVLDRPAPNPLSAIAEGY